MKSFSQSPVFLGTFKPIFAGLQGVLITPPTALSPPTLSVLHDLCSIKWLIGALGWASKFPNSFALS
jgi:hypothetical protein